MNVLVLNCGSSSAKFAVIDSASGAERISGIAQRLDSPHATLDWKLDGHRHSRDIHHADHDVALRAVVELLRGVGLADDLAGVGHRVVHGGARFSGSMPITEEVVAKIEECIPLGPLHNPPNLRGIQISQELFPKLPQVAVFDTAFHQSMPPRAYLYAVPYEWFENHEVRRYGFHGTSHRYVSEQAVRLLGLPPNDHRLVTAHLGNGCSLAAVHDGKSVDTTMGLTPLDGVVMGTRSGSIDPSIIAHMKKALHRGADHVMDQLNKRSGLLGISGLSNDMRTLQEAAANGHERAALAIEKFCYSVAKAAAGMVVSLGRLDALVFTGGIGENATLVRAKVVELLGFLGITLDPELNVIHGKGYNGRITQATGPQVIVVPTNEELMIAMDTAEIIAAERRAA
ncbi:acetate/propionate family kinase [Anaeromyxobacter sp. Fw109-5]|uniref:acetate/propionate family kinase n=1 Tax=Anaeromyxobacter sp. (strain Fw109-5) TaxID=404589 RepID=UPI000158A53F|nr:acetate kinase [Anaeromyxobacter sp. Fw109-5]ABS27295.1 acetate kinase [Anaeromyxobacter sp. Fw109-5]